MSDESVLDRYETQVRETHLALMAIGSELQAVLSQINSRAHYLKQELSQLDMAEIVPQDRMDTWMAALEHIIAASAEGIRRHRSP